MCIAPEMLRNGTTVACRKCWQCRSNKINDWVGRCIAESRTVVASHAVTLTYGRDKQVESVTYGEAEHERAIVLTYSDVQKWFKRLRKGGYPFRFFVTGEYGSAKGRAHWHVIMFWLKKVPEHVLGEMFAAPYWDHGHSVWTAPEYENFRYNCKYILKNMGAAEAERQGYLSMSKTPPLGAEYFARRARRLADEGLPLGDGYYTFPEAVSANGERVRFRLQRRSLQLYIAAYAECWRDLHGNNRWPYSELLDAWEDAHAGKVPLTREHLAMRKANYATIRKPKEADDKFDLSKLISTIYRDTGKQLSHDEFSAIASGHAHYWDDVRNGYVYKRPDGTMYLWSLNKGVPEWRSLDLARQHNAAQQALREAALASRRPVRVVSSANRPSSPKALSDL